MAPRTSFLIPVRNAADTLAEALASVCAQSDPDLEVVVVDDGSTDGSAQVALDHPDPRVRLIRLPPTGLVGALNAGLAHCRGVFVARMDADDRATPDRIAQQLPLFAADPTLAVVDGRVQFFRDQGPVPDGMQRYAQWINGIVSPDDFDRELMVECPVVHPAATVRADCLRAVGGYRNGPFPEDYDLWCRLHAAGWRLQKVSEVTVHMRDRPERLTRTDPRYGPAGFRVVRQEWLRATALSKPRRVALLGGGGPAGPWLRWLAAEGHTVCAVVDVAPARIGGTRLGVPVVGREGLAGLDAQVGLSVVSARGRSAVRGVVAQERPDWVEGRDWWSLA